jgi:8-oxo-dGTP diphosphatase
MVPPVTDTGKRKGSSVFHRIRASVVVPKGDRVLLVEACEPERRPSVGGMTGRYWNFPGGGLEGDESVFEGAERELREETGLEVLADRVIYIQEVVHRLAYPGVRERPLRQIELYVLAHRVRGEIRLDDEDVLDARFLSRDDVAAIPSYPPMLDDLFWRDMAKGFPEMRFLGTHYVG